MGERVLHVLVGLVDATVIDHRPDRDALARAVPDDELRHLFGEAADEAVVDPALDVGAVRADARLAGVPELRGDQPVDGLVEVGIVEDDVRRVATELE